MMQRTILGFAALAVATGWAVTPVVSENSVTFAQDSATRLVTIGYELEDAPAIVTVDIRTNGVSIGEQNFTDLGGDVNRVVKAGTGKRIYWRPDRTWEGHVITNGSVTAVVTAWSLATPPDYMVLNLVPNEGKESVRFYTSTNALPGGGLANSRYKTTELVMRRIPAAAVTWRKGTPSSQYISTNCGSREIPYYVTFTRDYYIGVYPVTQRQKVVLDGVNGSYWQNAADSPFYPQENILFQDLRGSTLGAVWPEGATDEANHAVDSGSEIAKFRERTGVTVDLPTDAQWEFAYRAGCQYNYYDGANYYSGTNSPLGHFGSSSDAAARPCAVGSYLPNAWGLYDMGGNVWELCLDWFAKDTAYSDGSAVVDPKGPTKSAAAATGSNTRIVRGGAYNCPVTDGRAASKSSAYPSTANPTSNRAHGFRLCCDADMSALAE